MKILFKYITRELFYYFFVILSIFCIILLAKETYDTRDEILDDDPMWSDVIQYIVLSLPSEVVGGIPLTAMFAALFAIGMMARNREIIAMVAAGVSFRQLVIPVLVFGVTVTVGAFVFSEFVAPGALYRSRYLYEVRIKGKNRYTFIYNDEILRRGEGGRIYKMASFDVENGVMKRPTILEPVQGGGNLKWRIEARSARRIEEPSGGGAIWEFEDMERWTFDEDGAARVEKFDVPFRMTLEDKLGGVLSPEKKVEEMNFIEIANLVDIYKRQQNPILLPLYQTALHEKFATPIACILLSLVGFAVAADLRLRRLVLAFTFGLGLGLLYFVVSEGVGGAGARGFVPPFIAAWSPVAVFSLVVYGLIYRLNRVI